MTGQIRNLLVVAKIPDGVRALGPAHDNESEVYFDSGVEVIGRVERCRLSSNRGKQAELWVEEEQEPRSTSPAASLSTRRSSPSTRRARLLPKTLLSQSERMAALPRDGIGGSLQIPVR